MQILGLPVGNVLLVLICNLISGITHILVHHSIFFYSTSCYTCSTPRQRLIDIKAKLVTYKVGNIDTGSERTVPQNTLASELKKTSELFSYPFSLSQ